MPDRPPPRPSRRPPLRHCPLCGVAMQAAKSRGDHGAFDRFECLSCETTIHASPVRPGPAREDD